jgi:HD-GYP domain-containing protein (c-di-GMP phosphodiesterase class II)
LQEIYVANFGGLDELSRSGVAAIAADRHARGHIQRVCRYSMMLTARVAPEYVNDPQFEYGFLLHDIGEIKAPASLLANPGALTDREWEVMKQHPEAGRELLAGIPFLSGASQIVYAHHERWNGEGYPRGLVGDEIPIGARILALCDGFNAITQDSPYRKAATIADARGEIHRGGRGQFWPQAVNAFLELSVPDLEAVRDMWLSAGDIVAPPSPSAASTGALEHLEEPVAKPAGWLARALAKRRGR